MSDGGGYYRRSSVLVSGTAGTGKTSLAAYFADAACRGGKRCLYFAFEESESQILRNMRSIGLDMAKWTRKGLLKVHSSRPELQALERHLVEMYKLIGDFKPQAVVVDPITNLVKVGGRLEVTSMLTRLIDYLKTERITSLSTSLVTDGGGAESAEGRIISKDWKRYNQVDVVFKPKNMTEKELFEGSRKVAKEFYSTFNVIHRAFRTFAIVRNFESVLPAGTNYTFRRYYKRDFKF